MLQIFSVSYGVKNRANYIRELQEQDHSLAVIVAAVHFEWVLKRSILVLGRSPTKALTTTIVNTFKFNDIKKIWDSEVARDGRHKPLGKVVTKWNELKPSASNVRGAIVHGNGTVSKKVADHAIHLFLFSAEQIDNYVSQKGLSLDKKLKARIKGL